jgi:hypothetical protein
VPQQHHSCRIKELEAIVDKLQAVMVARVGGERLGDTLLRLARLLQAVKTEQGVDVDVADWQSWLADCGHRLNQAAEAAGGDDG